MAVSATQAKQWARDNMRGLFSGTLTAFNDDFSLSIDGLVKNVEYVLDIGVDGIGYGHSEPWCLSHAERKETAEAFIQAVDKRVITYLHTIDHSAPETVNLTQHAMDIGADMVMISPPFEHAKSEDMIYEYFKYLADRTDIGIILLNTPHTGRLMSPELLDRLADIDAIAVLKNGINDFGYHVSIHRKIHDRMVVSLPREDVVMPCIEWLDQQVQMGTSVVYLCQDPDWHPVRAYFDLARAGDWDSAYRIWLAMAPFRQLHDEMIAPLWSAYPEHGITTQKVWMDAKGLYGGPVRPPMRNHTKQELSYWTKRVEETTEKVRNHPDLRDLK
jgi:4-hydroxy-tetrahydrodipicolinate synthase